MNKREYLNVLISNCEDTQQAKINKIINTLQKTDDIIKAKILSQKIMQGELEDVRDSAIDNLILAFGGELNQAYISKFEDNKLSESQPDYTIDFEKENLIRELENLKQQLKQSTIEYESKIKDLSEENNILKELAFITNNSTLIEVSDEDINELYIRYMKNGTTSYNAAIIINKIIPKSYYKLV